MVHVFHVKDFAVTFCSKPAPESSSLLKVAEIEGDLSDAYHLTQNIDEAWAHSDDPRVHFNAPPGFDKSDCGARSTSVGDVMEMDGVFYVVAGVGFEALENYEIPVKS